MDATSKGDIEIAVHIAAPSRGKDDAHYRALAAAYLDFETCNRIELSLQDSSAGQDAELSSLSNTTTRFPQPLSSSIARHDTSAHKGRPLRSRAPSFADTSPKASIDRSIAASSNNFPNGVILSPDASFRSLLDNVSSPRLPPLRPPEKRKQPSQLHSSSFQDSWDTPPSVVLDSQPSDDHVPKDQSSPATVLQLYLQLQSSPPARSLIELVEDEDSYRETQPDSVTEIVSVPAPPRRSARLTSSIYSSSSSPLRTRGSALVQSFIGSSVQPEIPHKRRRLDDPVSVAQTEVSTSDISSGQPPTSDQLPQQTPNRLESHISQRQLTASKPVESSPTSLRKPQSSTKMPKFPTAKDLKQRSRSNSQLMVLAPLPPTSTSLLVPSTLVTPALEQLSIDLPLATHYRPAKQTRPLRPMERGYWHVDTSGWNVGLRVRSWAFLEGYVGKGNAGWGVWCVREGEDDSDQGAPAGVRPGLRVYCWGSIVGQVWLLLYLVSERRVKRTGARWMDGDGEVIVVMNN